MTREKNFVTLRDAFHPEVALQEDALANQEQHDSTNRWEIVWAEAALPAKENGYHQLEQFEDSSTAVVRILDNRDVPPEVLIQPPPASSANYNPATSSPPTEEISPPPQQQRRCCQHGLLDVLIGTIIAMVAALLVFALDLVALVVYCLASGFHAMAVVAASNLVVGIVLWPVFKLVELTLLLVDTILLALSVLLSEILAAVAFLLCLLLGILCGGGCHALVWHQYIRRVCHLTRWAVRGGLVLSSTKEEDEEASVRLPTRGYQLFAAANRDGSEGSDSAGDALLEHANY